jgi:hypothetical protein
VEALFESEEALADSVLLEVSLEADSLFVLESDLEVLLLLPLELDFESVT